MLKSKLESKGRYKPSGRFAVALSVANGPEQGREQLLGHSTSDFTCGPTGDETNSLTPHLTLYFHGIHLTPMQK
jgi:hypothetical protein